MIECVDDERDVFAHIAVDIVRFGQKLRSLVDQVGRKDAAYDAVLVGLVESFHTICEQAECGGCEDPFCFSPLQLCGNLDDAVSLGDHVVDDDHILALH